MILRNPNLGNTYDIAPNVNINTTLDGDIKVAANNSPTIVRHTITLSALSQAQKDSLKSFLINNAGCQFTWKNHLGQTLICMVVADNIQFVQLRTGCTWGVTLPLEVL